MVRNLRSRYRAPGQRVRAFILQMAGMARHPNPVDLVARHFRIQRGGFAYAVINNKLYVAGGRDATNAVINLTWEYDPIANTYEQRADEPDSFQNNVPGSAVARGLLWVFGGGNPFNGAGASHSALPLTKALFNTTKALLPRALVEGVNGRTLPTTENSGRYYDPISDTWTSSPNMIAARSFPAGSAIGESLLIAAGGFNGFDSVATVQKEIVCIGGAFANPNRNADSYAYFHAQSHADPEV